MADMDGFREANNFGFGQTSQFDNFHVKGASNYSWGMKDRLSRIFNPKTGRAVMLAFDHGFIMGQTSIPANINKPVCLRSDAGSTILTELNRNVLIDIEDAIRYNASAMAVMFSAGDGEQEAITAANLVEAVDMGNRYGIPVMGVTAVGKQMARDSRYFALASRVCAENGASIVKTYYCDGFEKVAAACPVPVVIAGGKKLPEKEALELCYNAVNDGAAGVDMGRNVFQSENPAAMIQAVHAVVHEGLTPEQGFEMFKDLQ